MAHEESLLRPETVALDALIKATVAGLVGEGEQAPPEAMLFLGNWHQSIPSLVIQDPILEPVDKVVWMVIMSHARETGSRTAFPDYDTIASHTNIASTSTVARAIAILRLTRWLTLCARARQKSGRFTGNIYVLHDEPLPLRDALHLDAAYMAFVQQSEQHHHGRVRAVAQSVLASLDESIRTQECPLASESPIERRISAASVVRNAGQTGQKPGATGRYFAFSGAAVNRLKRPAAGRSEANPHRNQYSKAAKATHYRSGRSMAYKKTKTTTTTTNSNSDATTLSNQDPSLGDAPLIYPASLSDNPKLL
ncbi:MAG: STY4528 family pathogenicity island replication protein, partial [Parahaliea sp.]